ncbi:protein MpASHR1 [Marchantia polymorpha subsp. ruderalis]
MDETKWGQEDGYGYICAICEDFGELLCCEQCRQGFHLACIGLESCPDSESWLCDDCRQNKVRCFDCKEFGCYKSDAYRCTVRSCGKIYHHQCASKWERPLSKKGGIVCPHHYCDGCWNSKSNRVRKEKIYRCLKCPVAYHEFCMPDGGGVLEDIPGFMLCPKHNEEWKCQNDGVPTEDVKTGFDRLPLPSVPQDFKLPQSLQAFAKRLQNKPPAYVHIRRNYYLGKKPRKRPEDESMQCSCQPSGGSNVACDKDCLCGMLLTSCTTSCKCGDACSNVPFQKRPGRKMKPVKTDHCGWGLKADEAIKAGDFLVEYVGEVIDDETCEKRLWAMKEQGESNFYMCEISREMVIDATFKGNLSRFINHSCQPNCELQKWQIDGEIRIGVFSTVDIKKGDYVNYDYQFIQFGTDQQCHCGSSSCRGQLGKPQKQKLSVDSRVDGISSDLIVPRSVRRSRLCGRFSLKRGFPPINEVLRHQKNSIGEALKDGVVQADLHYQRRGEENRVGLRVKVWWPLDQKFYHGQIVRYDPTIGSHQIKYDDGEQEYILMNKERWEVEVTLPTHRKRGNSRMMCKKRFSQRIEKQGNLNKKSKFEEMQRSPHYTTASRKMNFGECYGTRKGVFWNFERYGESI